MSFIMMCVCAQCTCVWEILLCLYLFPSLTVHTIPSFLLVVLFIPLTSTVFWFSLIGILLIFLPFPLLLLIFFLLIVPLLLSLLLYTDLHLHSFSWKCHNFFIFYWIFYVFTFQMLSPFPVSPPEYPLPFSFLLHLWGCFLPTHSHVTALAFSYTRESSLYWTKGFSFHWCPTRPSTATQAAGAIGPSMCSLWLVI